MAQRVTVELDDDLEGGPAVETVRFGFGGSEYEIDLSAKNASALRRRVAPYLGHARKAGAGSRHRPARPAMRSTAAHPNDICHHVVMIRHGIHIAAVAAVRIAMSLMPAKAGKLDVEGLFCRLERC